MSPEVHLVVQFVVGLTFLNATIGKVLSPTTFFDGLSDFHVLPRWSYQWVGVSLIAAEGLIALAYLGGWFVDLASSVALCLVFVFLVISTLTMTRGIHARCLCFGGAGNEELSARTIIRLIALATLVLVELFNNSGAAGTHARTDIETTLLALAAALSVQIFASWLLGIHELVHFVKGCKVCRGAHKDHQATYISRPNSSGSRL